MQTVRKRLDELHKTEKNIRRHSKKQIEEYIRSIRMFGQTRPMVVTEDGEILVGNGLYEALTQMGETEADVWIISGLSSSQRKKLMLADNKVYDLGFTDVSQLDDILHGLEGDFDIPGYDADLLKTIVAVPSEIAAKLDEYGTAEPMVSRTPIEDTPVYSHEAEPAQGYAPPVRTEGGGFVAPPARTEAEERKYMICPHCGEKIWL